MIPALVLPVLFLTGCATIVGKDVFPLTINSNPDGANIVIVDESGKRCFQEQRQLLSHWLPASLIFTQKPIASLSQSSVY